MEMTRIGIRRMARKSNMPTLPILYRHSLGLLTDLYELTMAYGYWKLDRIDLKASFNVSFRSNPFNGGFTIAAGLAYALEFLENFHFTDDDLTYLARQTGNDDKPLFDPAFLDYLRNLKFTCDIDAVPEGTVVFPHEPLIRVTGPIIQAQILETALLNILNFQTLIATKAARICLAAHGQPVVEFGMRRAQGIDGALSASRASYIGGCVGTSNVLAGKLFDIPVKGTHAHSWVMSFDNEPEAFEQYARALPNNCIFLVDTYNTLDGVAHAIEVGKQLRKAGHDMIGIRLDSGDLAYLSIESKKLLDQSGFPSATIFASNDLDEHVIESLKDQGATVNAWGVGTRLATAYDQPALGGVYKLTALRHGNEPWQHKLKLSEQTAKISIPGILQVRRYRAPSPSPGTPGDSRGEGLLLADAIYDELTGIPDTPTIIDPLDITRQKIIAANTPHEDLLIPIQRQGQTVYQGPSIHDSRRRTQDQLSTLHFGLKRFLNPHIYPAGLEKRLYDLRTNLILKARGLKPAATP
jgi:nicotinate phosphoribosyltransferase